eukprot:CCRYP_003523-RA/>CCRYP_003523-RA protein AED:0.26 eAED:0.26 QI:0/-1/0/1/-1/1/1/0/506
MPPTTPTPTAANVSTEEILRAVSTVQDEAIHFLQQIVAIDSTLEKGEGLVQSAIYSHLKHLLGDEQHATQTSFRVERIPVTMEDIQNKPGFSPVDWTYDECKFNVVARSRHPNDIGDTEKSLILQGHVDVVPASDDDKWTSPPFAPRIAHNRMYGRGSGDMKAGVVAMIYALVALKRMGYSPLGEVTICTVIEEECTGNGALACLSSLIPSVAREEEEEEEGVCKKKTAVIIPEPFPFITTAQLGVLWFRAHVSGKPCHVLQTSAGSNAIEGAFALFSALKVLEEKYNNHDTRRNIPGSAAYKDMDHPINFNLGRIEGGNWASSVPSTCWFEARVGFFPGVDIEDVKCDVESTLHEAAEKIGVGLEISYRGFHAQGAVLLPEYIHGVEAKKDEDGRSLQREFVELLQACHALASKSSPSDDGQNHDGNDSTISKRKDLPLLPITCTTDARFYSSIHHDPDDVVVTCYGPEATNIHGIDESVCLDSMRQVTATIALFIRDWCGLVKD